MHDPAGRRVLIFGSTPSTHGGAVASAIGRQRWEMFSGVYSSFLVPCPYRASVGTENLKKENSMKYIECRIGKPNERNFPAIMAKETYRTILEAIGVNLDATFKTPEEVESQGWECNVLWEVEAENLEEAIQKIANANRDAEEAHQHLEAMHHSHWAERGGPIKFLMGPLSASPEPAEPGYAD